MNIGQEVLQPAGYPAFIPEKFPPAEQLQLGMDTLRLHSDAEVNLGRLDGVTELLPDLDFFIWMYWRKEAAYSSQIEGTNATMIDAIQAETDPGLPLPRDVVNIQRYIDAMNQGLKMLNSLPLSLRFISETHKVLMTGTEAAAHSTPGEFRKDQNWIGGTSPKNARFVPPPVLEMKRALNDYEKYLHNEPQTLPLIQVALAHAQFETIHPFRDGNGRTGRLMITFQLCEGGLLQRPVLYLSEFFKKHRDVYFERLHGYHQGKVTEWVDFFLEGVASVAKEAYETSKSITSLREEDLAKVSGLGRLSKPATTVLQKLYELPIVTAGTVGGWTGTTRGPANNLLKRLVELDILTPRDESTYRRSFRYERYIDLFS